MELTGRRRTWLAAAVFGIALLPRLLYWADLDAYPHFEKIRNRLDDQTVFHGWAAAVAEDREWDISSTGHEWAYWAAAKPGVYPQSPLYPWWISVFYRLAGSGAFDTVRMAQVLLGASASAALFLVASRLASWPAALFAGLGFAFFGPQVFYETTYLRAGVLGSMLVFVALLVMRADERGSFPRTFLAGLALGFLVLLRPNLLLVALVLLGWLLWRRGSGPWGEYRKLLAWMLLGLTLPILPIVVVNSWRSTSLAFVSSNAPINLFLGNVHDASGLAASTTPAYELVKDKGPPADVDLIAELRRDIAAHPGAFIRLQGRKLIAFFHPRELPNNLSFAMAEKVNPRLRVAFLRWHHLLPWACLGLLLAAFGVVERRSAVFPSALLFAWVLATVPFFVLGRLRMPAAVALLLLGAVAVDGLVRQWRSGRRLLAVALAAAATLAGLWLEAPPMHRVSDYQMAAAAEVTVGDERARAGDLDGAWRRYARAISFDPDHRSALDRLEAIDRPVRPLHPSAGRLCEQGQKAAQQGDLERAAELLRRALELDPDHATPHHFLANVYSLQDRPGLSMASLERALERDPRSSVLRRNLQTLRRAR